MTELLNKLQKKLVDPAVKGIKNSALGYVMEVNDINKTANVIVLEKDGTRRRKNNLSFDTGRGMQMKNLQPGDTVEIGYRNNEVAHSYIVRVHEPYPTTSFVSNGQDLPRFTNLY